jgi:hypothetical protein
VTCLEQLFEQGGIEAVDPLCWSPRGEGRDPCYVARSRGGHPVRLPGDDRQGRGDRANTPVGPVADFAADIQEVGVSPPEVRVVPRDGLEMLNGV